ncbi:MaoC family dehydratase N-terminal domain-containing protein [Halomarina salina]|uniref:MaoC family dehydratase N-terminal domain-containing protein n=1 Tax=Halomarina salina TaxID=1872699 RepID=A0ABD5RRZ2_9EURY|nr:MaoC family dehydratase N-terminal domain-containing protein [Halomarina salina]
MADVSAGDTSSYERTFTHEDVEQFTEVSNDAGEHHVETDDEGRLLVHGLLTATIPTKLGGDLDFVARTMDLTFHRPVYTGETIRCEMTITDVTPQDGRTRVQSRAECTNEEGETVLVGDYDGVVFD